MSFFPVPVSGQKIPRGWFARLVRFVNSLVLRGDGSYLSVTHTTEGTLIKPTPYLIDQLAQAGRAGAGGSSGTIGFPDYSNPLNVTITAQTQYQYNFPIWFIGPVYYSGSNTGWLSINLGNNDWVICEFQADTFGADFICIPIPANKAFTLNWETGVYFGARFFPCI